MEMGLLFRKLQGAILRPFCAHLSACMRCGRPWVWFVKPHVTMYTQSSGCFPMCEACWGDLTPDERLPYYQRLVFQGWAPNNKWNRNRLLEHWLLMELSVMEGR